MAKQTSLITFTGRLGKMIGYCRNKRYYLRSVPERVRQTEATVRAAKRFGIASRKGALIRHAIQSHLDIKYDSTTVNRLNKLLIQGGTDNLKTITGFRFNTHAGVASFFTKKPVVRRDGIVAIPAQSLLVGKDVRTVVVKVITSRIDFTSHRIIATDTIFTTIDAGQPFSGLSVPVDLPGLGIILVAMQITCIGNGYEIAGKDSYAADIIGVQLPQEQEYIDRELSLSIPRADYIHKVCCDNNKTYLESIHVQRE
ncbi:hypothetical protein [Chitinophaga rhizophila]|uniref:Uncharacterized protein n=1 Tax=Chitinophaga rhizophila TaxID=2866212 RepID=A0ABS7GAW7_9BACT|nr:hypothetical protein [Chitinophaga rhizophila]MBW8684481.1 hypothetical protein [Chitinophaga rhizophila]